MAAASQGGGTENNTTRIPPAMIRCGLIVCACWTARAATTTTHTTRNKQQLPPSPVTKKKPRWVAVWLGGVVVSGGALLDGRCRCWCRWWRCSLFVRSLSFLLEEVVVGWFFLAVCLFVSFFPAVPFVAVLWGEGRTSS